MPLTVPPADVGLNDGSTPPLGRHVNRHTMLTADSNTRASVPMMDVLTDLKAASDLPAKSKAKQKLQRPPGDPAKVAPRGKKRKADSEIVLESMPESRQSTPLSADVVSDQEQDSSETSAEEAEILGRGRRNAGKRTDHRANTPQPASAKKKGRKRPAVSHVR